MFKKIIVIFTFIFFILSLLNTLEIGKITLPDEITIQSDTLLLNGAGIRKKLIFKVYVGALYLKQKNEDANVILEADEPMVVRMHFTYKGVSPEKLINAWNEGFANANTPEELQPKIDEFNSYFTEKALKNDVYDIIYEPGIGTSVYIKDELKGTIEGLDFKEAVFAIWLGENTALPKLKKAMLGLK
ncbi:MAG: chalcone isomerase family protein [Candidatus Cloacimonetes bacterium]|nr:chalcone isomerase family protein [Candidatus Cloacimonadota bacterium]